MDTVPSGWVVRYEVRDTGDRAAALTTWRFCTYELDHRLARPCQQGDDPLGGAADADAVTVRLLLMQGVERPYRLKLWATEH